MRKFLLLVIVVCSISNHLYSQSDSSKKAFYQIIFEDAVKGAGNVGGFFLTPKDFTTSDWLVAGGAVLATSSLFLVDEKIQTKYKGKYIDPKSPWLWLEHYGNINIGNAISGTTYLTGLISGNDKIKETGRQLYEALFISGFTAITTRFILGRTRPFSLDNNDNFNFFESGYSYQSFPSGHITVAMALSTVLAEKIDTWWSRSFFYGLSGLAAYERIWKNDHWVSDVVLGGLIGYLAGYYSVYKENDILSHLIVEAYPSGVSLKYYF